MSTLPQPEHEVLHAFREWLAEHPPAEWGQLDRHRLPMPERARRSREWERALAQGGWLGLTWPSDYGGRGLPVRTAALIARELAKAGVPELFNMIGLDLVAPAVIKHGTEAQKREILPAILDGQVWCQGFSEPEAGSDLGAVKTRARQHGDRFVVSGHKVWSSFASEAQRCILLARTDPDRPKHRGLTCFLMPMDTPGLEIRPIHDITGDTEFFELFLDGCELSSDQVLGDVNGGWQVAMDVLASERTGIFTLLGTVHRSLEGMLDAVRALPRDQGSRRALEERAVDAVITELAVQWGNERSTQQFSAGNDEKRLDATMKVSWSELHQEIARIAVDATGVQGLLLAEDPLAVDHGRWLHAYLHTRAETIYAGTSEIQRNIIAERVLGLPREPRPEPTGG